MILTRGSGAEADGHGSEARQKWYAIFTDASGKQKWKAGYFDRAETLALARRLEDEARAVRLGDVDPQVEARRVERSRPIDAHVADYKAKLQAAGCSAGHVAYTVADVEKLVAFGGVKSASDITRPLIDRWVLSLQKSDPKSGRKPDANKTVNRRVSSVQQFLRQLHELGGVTTYTLSNYSKLPTGTAHRKRVSRPFDAAELEKLDGPTTPAARRDLYRFAAKTGLRMNEIRHAAPAWFDFDHALLTVPAHVAKSKKEQTIPLHADLLEPVRALCKDKATDARIFSMPTKQHVNNQLRADCKAAGVELKNVSFHGFRHTFCTLLARKNVHPALLQKLARHADLKMTLGYYTHLQRSDEAEAVNRL
jgi:integrase